MNHPSAELGLWLSVATLSDRPGLRSDGCRVGDVCSNRGAIECFLVAFQRADLWLEGMLWGAITEGQVLVLI